MNRRELIAALPIAALPEVTAPSTPEDRLSACVSRWLKAEGQVAATLRTLHAARETIYAAMAEGASPRTLARLVATREQARAEWRTAQRELAEAEAQMETAARWIREG